MDEAYARLSLRVGMFCGRVDAYLGRSHFGPLARAVVWDLTPELLDGWRQQARAMGIPESVVTGTTLSTAETEAILKIGTTSAKRRRSTH